MDAVLKILPHEARVEGEESKREQVNMINYMVI